MSQVEFDENLARYLERLYSSRDAIRRRAIVRAALGAAPGEHILDVGCGPGFYAPELLEEVGPDGHVVGVDSSPQMLAVATERCAGRDHAEFRQGEATALPVDDAAFDGAVCVQVLEYVADATAALAEIRRALKPGGRIVAWDVDWSTVSWHSSDPDRMRRVLEAWDSHLVHPALPRTLGARLRAAGFDDVGFEGHVFATGELSPETYGGGMTEGIRTYISGQPGLVPADELDAWAADLQQLDHAGEFFFSVTQFCFTATRPRGD